MKNNNFVECRSIFGKTIDFAHYKNVKVEELLGRGATFVSYKCTFKNNGQNVKGIVKEFHPQGFYQSENTEKGLKTLFDYSTNINREVGHFDYIYVLSDSGNIIECYLPAQREAFKDAYSEFVSNQKAVQSLLDEVVNENYKLRRYITEPLDVFEISPEESLNKNTFAYFELYLFEEKDFKRYAPILSVKENIQALISLCNVLDKLHQAGISVNDLKPENFLYDNDADMPILQLFDLGSARKVADNGNLSNDASVPCTTPFYGAPEYLTDYIPGGVLPAGGGVYADVYSIGAILMFILFLFDAQFIDGVAHRVRIQSEVKDTLDLFETCAENALNSNTYTQGFLDYAKYIVSHCVTSAQAADVQKRYHNAPNKTAVQQLSDDLKVLLDIYENKGIHPEVMLNNAIQEIENNEQYADKYFDPDLFTEIVSAD